MHKQRRNKTFAVTFFVAQICIYREKSSGIIIMTKAPHSRSHAGIFIIIIFLWTLQGLSWSSQRFSWRMPRFFATGRLMLLILVSLWCDWMLADNLQFVISPPLLCKKTKQKARNRWYVTDSGFVKVWYSDLFKNQKVRKCEKNGENESSL